MLVDDEPKQGYGNTYMWEPQSATEAEYQTDRGVLIL